MLTFAGLRISSRLRVPVSHERVGWNVKIRASDDDQTLDRLTIVNCVYLIDPPLTKNRNIFSRTGSFLMVLGPLESNRQSASYAFGFI